VYGPRQRGGDYAGVISIFIRSALASKTLPIDGDGLQSRDFTYIADVVNANLLASKSTKAAGNIYNIGSGKRVTILELARLIKELTKSSSNIRHNPERPGDVKHSLANITAAKRDLGFEPIIQLEEGLRKTIEWMT
ncbi:MAG: NAD-dependent epimerase/dehydratase family protein, partial [Promethearchaeota archaeon]